MIFLHYVMGVFYPLRDLAVAIFDAVTRKKGRCYRYSIKINAPRQLVWELVTSKEMVFEKLDFKIITKAHPTQEGVVQHFFSMGEKTFPTIAGRIVKRDVGQYYEEEVFLQSLSDPDAIVGQRDEITTRLEDCGNGQTRLHYRREIIPKNWSGRLSVPMGLRSGSWLVKTEAERRHNGGAAKPTNPMLKKALIFAASIASFALLLGWEKALILVVIILLHEYSHALGMILTKRGVAFVTLVPFFGGMAAPKKNYESEWQQAFVAWAGPGFSLLPTVLVLAYAVWAQSAFAAEVAFLSALINGLNLLPIPPLDGGVMLQSVARSVHHRLALLLSVIGAGLFLAVAIYLKSFLFGLAFLFALLQLVGNVVRSEGDRKKLLLWWQSAGVLAALVSSLGLYAVLAFSALDYKKSLKYGRGSYRPDMKVYAPLSPDDLIKCRLPTGEDLLDRILNDLPDSRPYNSFLSLAMKAGDEAVIQKWLAQDRPLWTPNHAPSITRSQLWETLVLIQRGAATQIDRFLLESKFTVYFGELMGNGLLMADRLELLDKVGILKDLGGMSYFNTSLRVQRLIFYLNKGEIKSAIAYYRSHFRKAKVTLRKVEGLDIMIAAFIEDPSEEAELKIFLKEELAYFQGQMADKPKQYRNAFYDLLGKNILFVDPDLEVPDSPLIGRKVIVPVLSKKVLAFMVLGDDQKEAAAMKRLVQRAGSQSLADQALANALYQFLDLKPDQRLFKKLNLKKMKTYQRRDLAKRFLYAGLLDEAKILRDNPDRHQHISRQIRQDLDDSRLFYLSGQKLASKKSFGKAHRKACQLFLDKPNGMAKRNRNSVFRYFYIYQAIREKRLPVWALRYIF